MRKIVLLIFLIMQINLLSCSNKTTNEDSPEELSSEISQLENEIEGEGFDDEEYFDESEVAENDAQSEEGELDEFDEEFSDEIADEQEEPAEDVAVNSDRELEPLAENEEEVAAEEPLEEETEQLEPLEGEELEMAEDEVLDDPLTAEEREFESAMSGPPVDVVDISYLANQNGGTVLIKADSEFQYKTRNNIETKQFIIEIANANLPGQFKRPYLLKEFKGASFAAINAYQKSGSSVARVVIQLKDAKDPIVQQEGNTLLVIPPTSSVPPENELAQEDPNQELKESKGMNANLALESEPGQNEEFSLNIDYSKGGTPEAYPKYEVAQETKDMLLSARTLEEFLLKHKKYYGKPISIQVDNIGIKDVLEMIGEEAGLNLALPNSLGGTVTLKLRKVPWDQAFILILKSNGLGYVREGNIIRIETLSRLSKEISNAQAIIERRYQAEPLQIKIIPISYINLKDAAKKLGQLKTQKGVVVTDSQTNSLIITDIEDSILKMEKLLQVIDVPPKQVLIEGKIIEAIESFSEGMGINWSASGSNKTISSSGGLNGGPVNLNPSLSVSPVNANFGGIATLGLNVGVLDVLGSLNAQIALLEDNNLAKVISSPRIITLTGEQAKFAQTLSVPFTSSTSQTSGATGAVTSTNSTATQNFSLVFDVTPVISSDRSIRLELKVSRSNPASGAKLNGLSTTSSSIAETNVIVGNNQTAVIGGIYSGSKTQSVNKVPVLGDIPILGWLFKSKSNENTKTELVIFVTPRIIDQTQVITKAVASKNLIDDQGLNDVSAGNDNDEESSTSIQ